MGVLARNFLELAPPGEDEDVIMIDSTHLKAHHTASTPLKKGASPPSHRADQRQRRVELEAARVLRRIGAAPDFLSVAGGMSDPKGALALLRPESIISLGSDKQAPQLNDCSLASRRIV